MAVEIGVNSGFVTTSPTDDPGGSNTVIDYYAKCVKDTSPATPYLIITEVGWYCDNATEAANFEVGLYRDVAGKPDALLYSYITNAKGTDAGWKKVTGLNWSISSSTDYWIAVQLDNTSTTTNTNFTNSAGNGAYTETGVTTLPSPWDYYGTSSSAAISIYAFVEEGEPPSGTNQWINVDDTWRQLSEAWINVDDTWRKIKEMWINVDDAWKGLYTS